MLALYCKSQHASLYALRFNFIPPGLDEVRDCSYNQPIRNVHGTRSANIRFLRSGTVYDKTPLNIGLKRKIIAAIRLLLFGSASLFFATMLWTADLKLSGRTK